jgi:hypothetical protein
MGHHEGVTRRDQPPAADPPPDSATTTPSIPGAGPTETGPAGDAAREAARRRRLAEVFGEVLPDTTRDDRAPRDADQDRESWYRANRPPHHGG